MIVREYLWRVVEQIKNPQSSSIARNVVFSVFTSAVTFLSGSVFFVILGRLLSVAEFGAIGLAMSVGTIIALAPSYGFNLFVIRELIQSTSSKESIINNIIYAKIGLSIVALICLHVYICWSGVVENSFLFWALGISAILFSFTSFFNSISKAAEDFFAESIATMAQGFLLLVTISISLFVLQFSDTIVAWGILSSRIFALIISIITLYKRNQTVFVSLTKFNLDIRFTGHMLRQAFPFALQAVFGTIYLNSDKIVIGQLLDMQSVGYYEAGMRFFVALMHVPEILMSAFYPRIASEFKRQSDTYLSVSRSLIHLMILIGGTFSVTFMVAAKNIILVFYGEKMIPAIAVLQILSLAFLIRFIASGYGLILIASRQQRIQLLGAIIACVVNVTLNLIFIPRCGYLAAAWVNVVTNIAICSLYLFFIRKNLHTTLLDGFLSTVRRVIQRLITTLSN